ncbi:hypothetical protein NMG60_11025496 [Bertholletia excelsa]
MVGSTRMRLLGVAVLLVLIGLLLFQPCKATRVLLEEEMVKRRATLLQSLPRGPVPPSGPSGCTNISGSGGIGCLVKERNFVGAALARTGAQPRVAVPLRVAPNQKHETN